MGFISLEPPTVSIAQGLPLLASTGTGLSVPTGVESNYLYNDLLLGDTTTQDKIRITRIEGLNDPDVRDSREILPARHGEIAFTALYGGRTISISGRIEALTLEKLRDMVMALKIAFSDLTEKPLLVLTGKAYERDHIIYCRKVQPIAMTEEQTDFRFFREFMVTLRASNPRIFSRQRITTSWTFPGSQAYGVSLGAPGPIFNRGSFTTQPLIVLRGPMSQPEISIPGHEDGAPLRLTTSLVRGEERWIYTDQRRIEDENGTQRFAEFQIGSTWPELPPGYNQVAFAASGLTPDSSLTFYHRHAWI